MKESRSSDRKPTSLPIGKLLIFLGIAVLAIVPVIIASKVFPTKEVTPQAPQEEFTRHLDRRIPALMYDYDIPGLAVALIKEGQPVWSGTYGYADLEAGREMTENNTYRFESISKSVTAWGVMKLVEEGKVDLDTPVLEYISSWEPPKTKYSWEKITVRRLLSGSAGLPLGVVGVHYPPGTEDIPSLQDYLGENAYPFREPGTSFFYSNVGFNLLELLIEEVTGRDFSEYMDAEVLTPLGMDTASFGWREAWRADGERPMANGYGYGGRPIPPYVYSYHAAGALSGTLEDVSAFAAAGMPEFGNSHRGVLSRESIETIYTPAAEMTGYYQFVFGSYGFGHFIEYLSEANSDTQVKAVSHGGQGSGWMTDFHVVPETGDGIIILSNSQRTWPAFGYILTDWAGWLGYSSIGMGVIITVQKVAWVFTAAVLLCSGLLLWGFIGGLIRGSRQFAPLAREGRGIRVLLLIAGLVLMGGLGWIISLDYWFLDSVLPIATNWLNGSLLLLGALFLLRSLFPRLGEGKEL